MAFLITDERQALVEITRKFRLQEIEPLIKEEYENQEPDSETIKNLVKKMGAVGLPGTTAPTEYGGSGLGAFEFALVIEEIAKSGLSHVVTLSVTALPITILKEFGTPAQKEEWIPKLASGEIIGAFALSEASSGSDAASLKTTAKKSGEDYILNGSKLWISNAPYAGVFIVMARTGGEGAKGISSFIVPAGTKGLSISKSEVKMGLKGSATCEITFENCKIPEDFLISEEGNGFKIAMTALDSGRINMGAAAVGLSQSALDYAVAYTKERHQFGKPLFQFQGLQWTMADLATEIEASRLLVYQAASLKDHGLPFSRIASMAKLKATDVGMRVTTDCVQFLGGAGYTTEYPVERYMRDAKVLQIVEGTNQIQKIVIARGL